MLQHINLYTCEGPSADASTFNTVHILLCSSMLTLVMVGFIVWSYFDYQHLLAVTDKSEQGYARLMTQYNQISAQLTAELGEQNAEEAVQSLKNDIEAQKALLDLIEQRTNQGADFSLLTRMLTSHQFGGLTIERIAFAEGGEEVAVTGRVRSSHEMADYLRIWRPFHTLMDIRLI